VTSSSTAVYRLFVGVDVAATSAAVSWMTVGNPPSRAITIDQTQNGYVQLQQHIQATGVSAQHVLVTLEATGTYWVSLAVSLHKAGFHLAVINPAQAHAFAKALLRRSKTDAIDAQTLAELGARLQPDRWTPPPAIYTEVQQRLNQRDALLDMRQQVRNQRHALVQQPVVVEAVKKRMDELVATLDEQIHVVEREIAEALQAHREWAAAARRLQTIPGVGLITAAWLLVTTVNFTLCRSAEEAVGYAGLAPVERQSGTSVRGRAHLSPGGNGRLRRALYLASLSAARHNPILKPFYTRLREAGKPAKVAYCAVARKLLRLAWAVVVKKTDFDPTYGLTQQECTRSSA
jgi:transposase